MKKMGKSKPVYERKKSNNSRYRSRSTKRTRGTPSGLTPKAKEAKIDAEPRFSAKFDGDGVLIEASAEREAANRRARIDNDWQIQRGRSNGRGQGRNANDGNSRNEDRNGKNHKFKHLKPNSGATNEEAAARGSNSLGHVPGIMVRRMQPYINKIVAWGKRKTVGPKPSIVRNAFKTLVVPMVSYACHLFADKLNNVTLQKELSRLNRIACLSLGSVPPSTPTATSVLT
jgi:hypothetical protein